MSDVVERLPLGFHPMSDVAWLDGRDLILFAHGMFVSARYCEGCWSEDTPISPAEYDGAVWSCFDDQFQFEIEEISPDPVQWWHGEVKGWADAAHLTRLSAENEALKAKLRMIVSHATGGALHEPEDIDRHTNEIAVAITANVNRIWQYAQEAARQSLSQGARHE